MTAVVTEQITASLAFTTAQRRTQARNAIENYLGRGRAGARDFVVVDAPTGKYGAGPGLYVSTPFVSRADADAAWADIEAITPSFLIANSVAEQFTSTEDIAAGVNTTVYIHRKHWPADPGDF